MFFVAICTKYTALFNFKHDILDVKTTRGSLRDAKFFLTRIKVVEFENSDVYFPAYYTGLV